MHPNFEPEWLGIERIISGLVPDSAFQELKEATSREIEFVAGGPFGDSTEPFERLVIPSGEESAKWIPNAIWDYRNTLLGYELCRLWELVFHEICDQHAAIDCAEQSTVALALMALSAFDLLAGKMFNEASETGPKYLPDDVFIRMGQQLDREHILLADNLDARGREILRHLSRQGKPMPSWEIALSDKHERAFLPDQATTRAEATTLRQFGTLSRCAKRAFYRAKDAYQQALDKVYEQRVQAVIKKNPFESAILAG